jgi:GR25 family glycosyltransferase involved in LPS biosynthesis
MFFALYAYNTGVDRIDRTQSPDALTLYVINLENRPDRWQSVLEQSRILGFEPRRIVAYDSATSRYHNSLLSPAASACWESHLLALQKFIDSGAESCLIAEDDFYVIHLRRFKKQLAALDSSDWDYVQFGFLNTGFRDRLQRYMTNIEFAQIKLITSSSIFLPKKRSWLERKLRVQRSIGVPLAYVPDDIRAGAHFYYINRSMALKVIGCNMPPFVTADGFFMSLVWIKRFRMLRVRSTAIIQSNSPSSIKVLQE